MKGNVRVLQHSEFSPDMLSQLLQQQRLFTLDYLQRLVDNDWIGPQHPELNPPLWEWLHLVWFQEYWCLRYRGEQQPLFASMMPDADARFDSSLLAHDNRWWVTLPDIETSFDYGQRVLTQVLEKIAGNLHAPYFVELSLYHEAMHEENFMRRAQLLSQSFRTPPQHSLGQSLLIDLPAQIVTLAPPAEKMFAFDNEKGHEQQSIAAVNIMNRPVTEFEFAEFVDAGGYQQEAHWSQRGWQWRTQQQAEQPLYWQRENGRWQLREFTFWRPPHVDQAMRYLNVYEAEAYGNWRGGRLPNSAEWLAASRDARFVIAPCWEWLQNRFEPYQGFSPDPYRDYSQTSFHSHQELRGHSPLLHTGLCRTGFRNYFAPARRDTCSGFRLVFSG